MSGYPSKTIRELEKMVKKHGWTWQRVGSGNVRWTGPNGERVTTGSHLSARSYKNALSYFRQAGIPRR